MLNNDNKRGKQSFPFSCFLRELQKKQQEWNSSMKHDLKYKDDKQNVTKDKLDAYIKQINQLYTPAWTQESDYRNPNDYYEKEKKIFLPIQEPFIPLKPLESIVPQSPKEPPPPKRLVFIEEQYTHISTLDDLIRLIDQYPEDNEIEYNIDMHCLHVIRPHLYDLNEMIGLHSLKKNIVDQILYFSQHLHKNTNNVASGDFLHTVIYGPPGTGKTEVAKIMGSIFSQMGILKKGTFKKVTRSDLIAGYLGQTAIKTRDVIQECLGGCLFIDEAYSLGNTEKKDSFAKECIDTLCEALSHHKEEIMVIIAGYEKELNDCFFVYNKGLESRFTWRFKTDDYNGKDLYKIFCKKVKDCGWSLSLEEDCLGWFERNVEYFTYYGRDMETLFAKTKLAHSRRIFCKQDVEKKKITMMDIEQGFSFFMENEEVKKRKDKSYLLSTMYI
jgi:AAA+ superfamily predicted ATPase